MIEQLFLHNSNDIVEPRRESFVIYSLFIVLSIPER